MSSPSPQPSLTSTQKYAAGTLFALALHQAQIHQARPLGSPPLDGEERTSCASNSSGGGSDSVSEDPALWVHDKSSLLRPVFRFLEIDSMAWPGIEETAASSPGQHHVGAFLRLLSEESDDSPSTSRDKELALSNAVDVMAQSMGMTSAYYYSRKEKHRKYEHECKEKYAVGTRSQQSVEVANEHSEAKNKINDKVCTGEETFYELNSVFDDKSMKGTTMLSHEKKIMVLYELLTACLAGISEDNKKSAQRKGYDARHRVALRLLAAWLDIKCVKMEAMETIVACTAMSILKEEQTNDKETNSPKRSWAKWKRGGIIGAAAITGGALLAITGAAGAGLTGSKMARRIGDVDEFEFKAIGDNHNHGRLAVEILISGFVFEEADFVRPWEGQIDNLERYALQWESKNLIAVSTAIQDWLTSRLAMEFMKQGAMLTVLSTLLTALAWPATLLAATDFIDSKWTIAVDRSDKAGKLLAEVLLKGLQGYRPVTLIGFSLGARVVYKCLEYLAESEHNAGLVERVILLGAPIPIKDENWEAVRKIVAGRFVNAYSTNDWILGVAFRASLLSKGLAGIQPINVPGIENVDVTEIIEGHSSYLWATQDILDLVELDAYPVFRSTATKI